MANIQMDHILAEIITLLLLVIILLLILPIAGGLLWAILINTIVGFIVIFFVNAIFNLGIRYSLLVFVFVAIFGLLAVAVIIVLNILTEHTTSISTSKQKSS